MPLALAAIFGLCFALAPREPARPARATPRAEERAREPDPVARPRGPFRWIVAGGGASPDLNQVQLEQDIALARETFSAHGAGLVLFAGGPGSMAVQVLGRDDEDELRASLADLVDPRGGRDSTYRRTALEPDGAASAEAILSAIEGAIAEGDAPLTIYLAGHGLGGEAPAESTFLTWGADDLWVEDLATVLDRAPEHRRVRFVITACFSGGFAELAFASADPERGAATTDRCGLFATVWDRPAAGCDPNPDRGAQEGYGIHFLNALRGRDRDGSALAEIDLDGDGAISLLEAHTRARIASGSIDIPTTTSERFLREVAGDSPRSEDADLPEERAVIEGLRARLSLESAEDARARLDDVSARLDASAREIEEAEDALAIAEDELLAVLLHRWPVLDDPWHPAFSATLEENRMEIASALERSPEARRRRERIAARDRASEAHDALMLESAPLERLVRALDTIALAGRLRARGGQDWERYTAFVACERGTP